MIAMGDDMTERARIVAWLRDGFEMDGMSIPDRCLIGVIASSIESGEHMKKQSDG